MKSSSLNLPIEYAYILVDGNCGFDLPNCTWPFPAYEGGATTILNSTRNSSVVKGFAVRFADGTRVNVYPRHAKK